MQLSKGSIAEKMYQKGKKAAAEGNKISDNPCVTAKYLHLSNWWVKGFKEVDSLELKN